MDYIHNVIIPATNQAGSRRQSFKDLSLDELMKFFGLMYAMEIVKMPIDACTGIHHYMIQAYFQI